MTNDKVELPQPREIVAALSKHGLDLAVPEQWRLAEKFFEAEKCFKEGYVRVPMSAIGACGYVSSALEAAGFAAEAEALRKYSQTLSWSRDGLYEKGEFRNATGRIRP